MTELAHCGIPGQVQGASLGVHRWRYPGSLASCAYIFIGGP